MANHLKCRLLDESDTETVQEFLKKYYTAHNVIAKLFGVTNDNLKNSHFGRLAPLIEQGNSFGAFDENGKICATMIGAAWDADEIIQYKRNRCGPEIILDRIFNALVGGDTAALLGTSNFWEAKHVCVNPRYKGTGVTGELLDKLLERAQEKGCRKLILFAPYNPEIDDWGRGKPLRLIHHGEYIDPVTGKREFEGLLPRYTHHALFVLDVRPMSSL